MLRQCNVSIFEVRFLIESNQFAATYNDVGERTNGIIALKDQGSPYEIDLILAVRQAFVTKDLIRKYLFIQCRS